MNDRTNNPKKNAEGYPDMTPHDAIKKIEDKRKHDRVHKLVHTLFYIANLAGFEIVGRITLKDKKTGRVWK